MIVINTQQELEALIDDNNNIVIDGDLEINCTIEVRANIKAWDIEARSIKAWDINALDINAEDIKALNINAWNINALDINARNIEADNIKAGNINARNIEAANIKAGNISYYGVCFAYNSISCKSIKGRRANSKHLALDGEITIINNNK